MAQTYKVLGSVLCNATIGTGQTLYQVPAGTSAVVASIVICNQGTAATYRVGVSSTTTFDSTKYIAYGTTVAANDTHYLQFGLTMGASTYLLVSGSSATINVIATGCEIT